MRGVGPEGFYRIVPGRCRCGQVVARRDYYSSVAEFKAVETITLQLTDAQAKAECRKCGKDRT